MTDEPEIPWWDQPFRSVVQGRRVIVAAASVTTGVGAARALRSYGTDAVMVYALSPGDQPDDVDVYSTSAPADSAHATLAEHWERHTSDLTLEARAAFDAFDPDGRAIVFRMLGAEPTNIAGRRVVAFRPDSWTALEDKTVIDAFWGRHGVRHQPSTVVRLRDAPTAAAGFDLGGGTVWAADSRDGLHAAASLTKWVRNADDIEPVTDEMRPHCDRVRVMPFVEGIPCSIHGVVLPDGVAVLRPVEMLTLRQERWFRYLGASTFWDPPDRIRTEMRRTARSIGEGLAEEVDFRGAFSVDGVAAADGFWPTEVNPRVGGGLQALTHADGAPSVLLFELIVAGASMGLSALEFERRFTDLADAERSCFLQVFSAPSTTRAGTARHDGTRWVWAGGDNEVAVSDQPHISFQAQPIGVLAHLTADALPHGDSAAGLAADFAQFLDREMGTSVGSLEGAIDPYR